MSRAHRLSRRSFLLTAASVPLVARFAPGSLFAASVPRVVVIGAGAFGGWTALHLRRLGAEVVAVDSWGPGNARSSSGGETRVIRSVYGADRIYTGMVKRAYELWEELQQVSAESLYLETGALWLHRGDDAYVRSAVPVLKEFGFPLEKLASSEAAKRYPQIDFGGVNSVWLEGKAGALFARRACVAVRDQLIAAGGTYRTGKAEPGPISGQSMSSIRLANGEKIDADAFVFACGPWLGKVFPEIIGDFIRPTRQEVYYFGTPAGSMRFAPDRFPVWIDFGGRIFYGLPNIDGGGVKVADDTRGPSIDPTAGDRTTTAESLERARAIVAQRFPDLAKAPLLKAEVCQYENSPDGHLLIDRHPEARNVWVVGGGSGHGFKLGPAVGEIVAQAIVAGKQPPGLFNMGERRQKMKTSTQFESDPG